MLVVRDHFIKIPPSPHKNCCSPLVLTPSHLDCCFVIDVPKTLTAVFRFVPRGSTPRKLEPTRFRRTSDGGAPRKEAFDSHGI
jgi:hypothetical protein